MSVAPPLDPSMNWPRELRAATFALVDELERISADIREANETLAMCTSRLQRAQFEKLVDRWTAQRAKLRRFYDHLVFADIRSPRP